MAIPFKIDERLEREWLSLARRVRLARGFCFIVYFVDDQLAVGDLKERLRENLDTRSAKLVEVAATSADDLVSVTLSAVFDSAEFTTASMRRPFWVEAHQNAGTPEWDSQRAELL